MQDMGNVGGRRTLRAAVGAVALALATAALGGCAGAVDRARNVQTHLGRISEITDAQVVTPSWNHGAAIEVTYTGIDDAPSLAQLIAAVHGVADEEDYPAYRLTLRPAGGPDGEELVVDGSFSGSGPETAVLADWFTVTDALLGAVEDDVQTGSQILTIDAGGGVAHDVTEAQRIGYGGTHVTWVFRDDDTTFTAGDRVTPADVALFQAVQRSVSSTSLAASAPGWQLDRRDGHVRLDLDVTFTGGPVPPARLTVTRYAGVVAPLVQVAIAAIRREGLPAWLSLHHATAQGDDVFGVWSSERAAGRGRDRLGRGWDDWLLVQARRHS